jgi:hypothetical protein
MKTTIERIEELTIEAFADLHGLEMIVKEDMRTKRFTAHFRRNGRDEGNMEWPGLSHLEYSESPEGAINAYARGISGHTLYFFTGVNKSTKRVEHDKIKVPRLLAPEPPKARGFWASLLRLGVR